MMELDSEWRVDPGLQANTPWIICRIKNPKIYECVKSEFKTFSSVIKVSQ